jgi:hypothetical protein
MVTHSLSTCCLALVCCGIGWTQPPSSALEAPRGKVLILDNDRVMEGDIVEAGDHFRIRRGGSEISIPVSRGRKLVGSLEEAYQFMKGQTPQAGPDDRLKLAKWCAAHGMRDHALAEARAALALRPNHEESKLYLRFLERSAPAAAQPAPAAEPLPPVPEIDVSADSFTLFVNKVQPVLLNTCGQCHNSSHAGKFQLFRAQEGGSRAATQRNLAAALGQVSIEKPAFSPLLTKAISNHAINKSMDAAPIRSRQAEPFRILQVWVEQVVLANPHLREMKITAPPPQTSFLDQSMSITNPPKGPLPQSPMPTRNAAPKTTPPPFADVAPLPSQASVPLPVQAVSASPAPALHVTPTTPMPPSPPRIDPSPFAVDANTPAKAPATPEKPRDEFDPRHFNQKYHPDRGE